MNVCFVVPPSVGIVQGGIRTQALQTARHLERLGVAVSYYNPWEPPEWEQIDLVHIFNASISNYDLTRSLQAFEIPYVISPVIYSNHTPGFIRLSRSLEQITKKVVRGVWTDYAIIEQMCAQAERVLPNTSDEARLIAEGFGISPTHIEVIPNGVEARFLDATPDLFIQTYQLDRIILYVGNIGAGRKNALRMLRAMEQLERPCVLIGKIFDNDYARQCREIADRCDHIHLLGEMAHDAELLASAYAASEVFVLPGLFETPGIAALEAALTGSKIAITEVGGTREYFGEEACYFDPTSVSQIRQAMEKALDKPADETLKNRIKERYLWAEVARKTLEAYQPVS